MKGLKKPSGGRPRLPKSSDPEIEARRAAYREAARLRRERDPEGWRLKNAEYQRRWRERNPGHSVERYRENPDYFLRARKRSDARYPERVRARIAARAAIRRGEIVRPDHCQECRTPCRPEAHHHRGYDRPLDVVFLCRPCHVEADSALGSFYVRYPKPEPQKKAERRSA